MGSQTKWLNSLTSKLAEVNSSLLGSSTGQGTITRLPQLTQVASNIYQEISKLSKVAKTENTFEPQGQACIGPSERRSVPNFGGRLSLFFDSLGRRNILGLPSAAHRAPLTLLIRLTAHSITIYSSGN
jgi:hypothetical protein